RATLTDPRAASLVSGGVAERLNAAALKAVRGHPVPRGFESLPLRSSLQASRNGRYSRPALICRERSARQLRWPRRPGWGSRPDVPVTAEQVLRVVRLLH